MLGAAGACVLALAALFVFRSRPAPASPPASPATPVVQRLVSPFTGEPVASPGPELAVKIDNIVNARPQTGLGRADIVYVLPVEGGGSGRAVVLRDGKAWQARWSRPHGSDGTTFTTGSGRRMTFARGPVWVVLAYS